MRWFWLVCILTMAGCTGWRTAANRSINGAASLARSAEKFEARYCGDPMAMVSACKDAGDAECKKFTRCETVAKSTLTMWVAILAAQHALVQTSANKETVHALVLAAMKSYQPIAEVIKEWKR